MKKAVIVIPTYNEKENIQKLIPEIFTITSKEPWDISVLVVDDTSPDGTGEAVKHMQKNYPKLHIISGKKKGLGEAYIHGFNYAIEHYKPNFLFEMDADGQHNPNLIPSFLKALDAGADFVIGSRYIKGGSIPAEWEFHRKFLSYFGNNLVLRFGFMEFSITDWTSGYRAVSVPFIQETIECYRHLDGYTFQIGIVDQAVKHGLKIKEIPLQFQDRKIGSSKIQTFKFIFDNLFYILRNSPFIKFVFVGLGGALVDFGIAALLISTFDMFKPTANAISAEIAIIFNFMMNNFWSFKYKQINPSIKSYISQFAKFNLVSSGSILIQWGGMYIALIIFGDRILNIYFAYVPSWILYKILIIAFCIIPYSYFMYNHFVWKKK